MARERCRPVELSRSSTPLASVAEFTATPATAASYTVNLTTMLGFPAMKGLFQ